MREREGGERERINFEIISLGQKQILDELTQCITFFVGENQYFLNLPRYILNTKDSIEIHIQHLIYKQSGSIRFRKHILDIFWNNYRESGQRAFLQILLYSQKVSCMVSEIK